MDAFGEQVPMFCELLGQLVVFVGIGSTGVDYNLGADGKSGVADCVSSGCRPHSVADSGPLGLHIVGGDTAVIQARPYEVEDESSVVIIQVAIGILEAAGGIAGIDDWLLSVE